MIKQIGGRAAAVAAAVAVTTGLVAGTAAAQPAAPLNCSGWSGQVYISVSGGPTGFTVSGKGSGFTGHIQILGPNGLNVSSSKDVLDPYLNNIHGTGAGRVDVYGWIPNGDGNGWHRVGSGSGNDAMCVVF